VTFHRINLFKFSLTYLKDIPLSQTLAMKITTATQMVTV